MLGIKYLKTDPTHHIIHYRNSRILKEGAGISFFYHAPTSTIAKIPLTSVDVPFSFLEPTMDYQEVNIQGQLTYRISNPTKIASLLDFTISSKGIHLSDDPKKLRDRIIQHIQVLVHGHICTLKLREALHQSERLVKYVQEHLTQTAVLSNMGIEILDFSVIAIIPTPETAKALESEAREAILQEADQAIFKRRNSGVELERKIKENELQTEQAVVAKRRAIAEEQMASDIAIENERQQLISVQVRNEKEQADSRAYALDAVLSKLKDIDWKTLMAASGSSDAGLNMSLGFRELAENAQKIGQLNITPDLLETLVSNTKRSVKKN